MLILRLRDKWRGKLLVSGGRDEISGEFLVRGGSEFSEGINDVQYLIDEATVLAVLVVGGDSIKVFHFDPLPYTVAPLITPQAGGA